jgi:general secretion pathway protein M
MFSVAHWPAEKRKRLAIGLLVAGIVLLLAIFALPVWLVHRHYDDALEQISQRLTRYERLAATRAEQQAKLEAVRALNSRKYFLKASAPSLAAAEIQDRAKNFVEANGGRPISVQVAAPKDEGRFKQVTVTVQLNANITALRKILYAIETNEPYLFVDNLMIRSQVPPGFKASPGFEPEMFIQFDVSAYAVGS